MKMRRFHVVLGALLIIAAVMFDSPFCLAAGVLNMLGNLMYENY